MKKGHLSLFFSPFLLLLMIGWSSGAPESTASLTLSSDRSLRSSSISLPVTCSDGIQNGDETGVDCGGSNCPPCTLPFITTWKTDNPGSSNNTSITVPTYGPGTGYNYDVDWDNDGVFDEFDLTGDVTHDFGTAGTYTIRIQGDFPGINFFGGGDKEKILSVDQWGGIAWVSMNTAFSGASNLVINATDVPDLSNVTGMSYMFSGATSLNQDIGHWDVSNVQNMEGVFAGATSFNQDISSWDVSNVRYMERMFSGASAFNQDIGNWDVSSVEDMEGMFNNASSFDQNLGNWDLSGIPIQTTAMIFMLDGSGLSVSNYDNTLIGWDASGLTNLFVWVDGLRYCNGEAARNNLLSKGWYFDGDAFECSVQPFITTWKTDNPGSSNNTSITVPTYGPGTGYNYDVDWDNDGVFDEFGLTGDVTHDFGTAGTYTIRIQGDFPGINFSGGGDKEKILSVDQWGGIAWVSMNTAFSGASNLVINATDVPDLSNVTGMSYMFSGATSLNQDIGHWDVSNVQNMEGVFAGATSFNQDISSWDVSNVRYMERMFSGASAFNQDIGNWDVSSVEDMEGMFNNASSFDQNLGNWDLSGIPIQTTAMIFMLDGSGLSVSNYDNTLIGWDASGLTNLFVWVDGLRYCNGEAARNNLLSKGWYFDGDTKACGSTCEISAIAVSNLSSCTPGTDTYTADVTVSFQGAPATGTLELSGDGSATVAVGALDSPTSHVFVGVQMPADGGAIDLTATFLDAPSCVFTESNAGTAPASCAPTCSDGIQNGDETGVDCGGSNCPPCSLPCLSDPAFNQVIISDALLFPTTVQSADFDGDGDEDVLVSYFAENHLAWHENNGDGTFGNLNTVLIGAVPYFSHAADLDGDGDTDIICTFVEPGTGTYWFENLGSGSFSSPKTISSSLAASMIQTADLDEDDVPDVFFPVVGSSDIRWHKNFGNGSISTNGNIISSPAADVRSIYPADLDGDGDTDILAGSRLAQNDNNLVWYENLGFGSFDPTPKVIQSIPSVGPSISVFSIDLDNDNDFDVIYGHTGMVAWHENLGNGTFGSHQVLNNIPGTVEFVYAEDLTGNGHPDVFSASEYNISWYKNMGGGAFDAPETIQTITGSSGNYFDLSHLDVADINGDGYLDLLSATTVDHTVAWYDNACIGTPDCPSPDTFKITAIQAAPPLVLDEDGEWFQVYNSTDTDYDLQGYIIQDDGTDSHTITTSLLLPASGSITLGNNADTLTNGGVHIDYAYGSDITLDDEEDEIVLVCSGTEVARAEYSGGLFAGCTNPTVALGADGTVSITPAQVEDGTMALDGLAGLWLDVTDFDCSNQGQGNPVELTVVDTDGDTSTCMANVTVIDDVAPTAVCADVTIALDSAGMAVLVADSLDGGSTDNCATAFTYEASQVAFSCDDLGEQSVTLTVSDGSPDAESGNCTATVTVVDDAAPVAECQDAAVQLDAAGMATLSPEAVNNGSYDNCTPAAGLALEVSQSQFDCGDLGQQTVSLFVSDGSPNSGSGSCMAMVTVEDLLPPQAECTDVTVQLEENGTAFLPSFNVDGGSSDNCGTLDLALSQSSFDCTHLGENAVDMIVTDGSNNMDTCMAIVTVEDMILPQAICQPFSVSLDSTGSASITADNVDGGSTDNCGGLSLMLSQSTFGCGDIGSNTVTLTVTDASNNSAACQAAVTVTDDLPPEALCTDISVALDSLGQAMITTDLIDGASYDNCGLPELSLSQSQFDCSHLGANQVVLTATDGSNNMDSCTAIVTVEDLTSPEAICSPLTIQLDNMGMATLSAAAVGGSSMDNCVTVDLQLNQTSFDCSHLGQNTVTLTVTDGSNNTDLCTANITVQDLVPPTASCEPLILLELDPSGQATLSADEVDAGSLDNCEVADLSLNQTTFSCTDLGMQTVELTVTDNSGNISACTTELQITDVSKPLALCQDIEVELGPDGTAILQGSSLDGGSLDNCGIATLTPNPAQLTCEDIGFNTVILTVADASGNFSTCVSSVSLSDNTPPNAVCVPSLTLEVDPEHDSPEIISSVDLDAGSSDNCGIAQLQADPFAFTCQDIGAATPVTLTVIDDNGLESSCTSMVTVVNALEGQACDDGDDCTENDIYDANCNCAGTLIDEDNNGVCDFNECTSPINLQSSNITANTADLSWTAVGPAVEYLVRYRINGGGALNALATSESITLTGLPGGAQIEWRVRAICSSGQSSFSIVDAFMTLENTCPDEDDDGVCDENDLCPGLDDDLIGQPCDDGESCTINDTYGSDCVCYGALLDENNNDICDLNETGCLAPENLQVLGITPNMATLTWDAVVGADSYRVGYITPGQSGTVMIVNTNMVTLTGLSPESEYLWQVRANCDMTNSDNVVGPAFTTSATGCPDADGDGVCDGDDQCPDFDDMLIGTSCNDYDNCTVNDMVTTDCECVGTIIDNNDNGVCDLDELCAAPSNFSTNALSPTSGTVSWSPVPGAVVYKLQYLIAGYGTGGTQLSDTSYTFEGLPPGSIIQWRVKTLCTSGSSSWEVGPALPLPNSLNGGGGAELRTGDRLPPVDWEQVSRELSELQFDIFPNPARDEASLVLSRQAEGTEAVVYNLWGQELARYSLSGIQVQRLNVTEWRAQNTAVVVVLFEPGQPPKTKKLLLVW